MRDHESPDIPFTILRTRFPIGITQNLSLNYRLHMFTA